MTAATIEMPVAMTLADAIAAIRTRNADLLATLAIETIDIDGAKYMLVADSATDTLVGGPSKGNKVKENAAHKLMRHLDTLTGARWVLLVPEADAISKDAETGLVKVKRPEGPLNRAAAELAAIGELKVKRNRGLKYTAEMQAVPAEIKKGLPAMPKSDAVKAAIGKDDKASLAIIDAHNAHQTVKAELMTVLTKWY